MRVLVAAEEATVRERALAAADAVGGFDVDTFDAPAFLTRDGAVGDRVLVLVPFHPGDPETVQGLRALNGHSAEMNIAVMAQSPNFETANRALLLGACGVLDIELCDQALGHALRMLLMGNCILAYRGDKPTLPLRETTPLSDREQQVLRGICDGLQNKEIAHLYQIKEVTVKMHVRAIIRKLNARNRTHAAMLARDNGLAY